MYYGLYSNIRDSAWQCLIDFQIKSLPVNVLSIAESAGIHVIKDSDAKHLKPDEYAKSYSDGKRWIIIYNDQNDIVVSRFYIAHELGHFFLGHDKKCVQYAHIPNKQKKPKAEQQADMFALRLLCPACVLKDLNISSPEDLANICRIPLSQAEIRYQRLKELKKRNKYFTSPIELEVYKNFENYLTSLK